MTLIRLLPFLIGEMVPEGDDHWECFLMLWTICNICTAFSLREEHSEELAWLIEAHHELYITLYGKEKATPKFHFMVHLASQIKRYT